MVATVFHIPPVVLICLNLNDPMNLMFQTLTCVTLGICSTHMHRSLYVYANSKEGVVLTPVFASITTNQHIPGVFYPMKSIDRPEIDISQKNHEVAVRDQDVGGFLGAT